MTRTSRCARTTSLAAMIALLVFVTLPAAAVTPSSQPIAGRVVDATHHRPVADQPVTLSTYRGETRLSTASATTDPRGAFSFAAPAPNATSFQVTTTYRGGSYRSPLTQLEGPIPPVTLKVFSPTTDAAAIAQTNWVVWVDPMPGGIVVQQDFAWQNDGTTAYIGPDARGGVVTEAPLSPAATNVQYLGLFLNGGGRVVGDVYQGTQPIVPGGSSATVRYVVASLRQLRLVTPLPTSSLHVFVGGPGRLGTRDDERRQDHRPGHELSGAHRGQPARRTDGDGQPEVHGPSAAERLAVRDRGHRHLVAHRGAVGPADQGPDSWAAAGSPDAGLGRTARIRAFPLVIC